MYWQVQKSIVEEFNYSIDVARALIVYDDWALVLATNPMHPKTPSRLELPGGCVDEGEDPLEAIKREVEEETGLTGLELRPIYSDTAKEDASQGGHKITVYKNYHIFGARLITHANVKIGDEHRGCVWATNDRLGELIEHRLYRKILGQVSLANI